MLQIKIKAEMGIITLSQKKTVKIVFPTTLSNVLLNLIIFGTKMAKTMKSCNVHSFSTSP